MKKMYTGIIALLVTVAVQAQIEKGTRLPGGQLSFTDSKVELSNNVSQITTQFNLQASIGWAHKKNIVFGFWIGIAPVRSRYKRAGSDSADLRGNDFAGGVFNRRYNELGKKFYFFTEGLVGAFFGRSTATTASNTKLVNSRYGLRAELTPGLAYQMSSRLFLELLAPRVLSVSYTSNVYDNFNVTGSRNRSNELALASSLGDVLRNLGMAVRWTF
jgi:hypothetical protein